MEIKINKFENPARMAELNPEETLVRAGFCDGMSICDIGAGTGIFSLPAARISKGTVYALEISDDLLTLLKARKEEARAENLIVRKVETDALPATDESCDMAVMVTVLHEIENKENMLKEIRRVLKDKGKLVVIEFHKKITPFGPPTDHRIGEEEVLEICGGNGFSLVDRFSLGENFYCTIFGH